MMTLYKMTPFIYDMSSHSKYNIPRTCLLFINLLIGYTIYKMQAIRERGHFPTSMPNTV